MQLKTLPLTRMSINLIHTFILFNSGCWCRESISLNRKSTPQKNNKTLEIVIQTFFYANFKKILRKCIQLHTCSSMLSREILEAFCKHWMSRSERECESEERMCKSCLTTSFMNNFRVSVKVWMQSYYVIKCKL